MRALVLAAWVSTSAWAGAEGELRLTVGWVTVLDEADVQAVTSDDVGVVRVVSIDHGQVVLLGVGPGRTTVAVDAGGRQVELQATVLADATWHEWDSMMRATVEHRRRINVPSLTRVIVGDPSMCDARIVGPDELEVVPRRPGRASFIVWAGGLDVAHRRRVFVLVEAGGVVRSMTDSDAVMTEPADGRLVLVAGERATLELQATSVGVRDQDVVRVRSGPDGELVVEGLRSGATWLYVWTGGPRPALRFVVVHESSPGEVEDCPAEDAPPVPVRGPQER